MERFINSSNPAAFLFAFFAILSMLLFFFLCLKDRLRAATLCGAMSIVSAVLGYFPMLSSLDALSVHVKMQENLGRSEEILTAMQNLAVESAKSTLFSLATTSTEQVENSVLNIPISSSQERLINDVMSQLNKLNLSQDQKREILNPLLRYIDFQLSAVFRNSIEAIALKADAPADKDRIVKSIDAVRLDLGGREDKIALQNYFASLLRIQSIPEKYSKSIENLAREILDLHDQMSSNFIYSDEMRDFFVRAYNNISGNDVVP